MERELDTETKQSSAIDANEGRRDTHLEFAETELDKAFASASTKKQLRQIRYDLEYDLKYKRKAHAPRILIKGNNGLGQHDVVSTYLQRICYGLGILTNPRATGCEKSKTLIDKNLPDELGGYLNRRIGDGAFIGEHYGTVYIGELQSLIDYERGYSSTRLENLVSDLATIFSQLPENYMVVYAGTGDAIDALLKHPLIKECARVITLDDYGTDEMLELTINKITAAGFEFPDDEETRDRLRCYIEDQENEWEQQGRACENALDAERFCEDILKKQRTAAPEQRVIRIDLIPVLRSRDPFDLDAALADIVGLEPVKEELLRINATLKANSLRAERGFGSAGEMTYNLIFSGNPGTGKTMMAGVYAQMLHQLGVIKKTEVVETNRGGLVGEYQGHTAVKTTKVLDSALDGVVFIDEAYALFNGKNDNFGKEAMDTITDYIDKHRDRLVVIMAGYTKDMERLLSSNPGLESRFPTKIEFPDYSAEELCQIGETVYKRGGFQLTDTAHETLLAMCARASKVEDFGNGRYVRNVYERSIRNQSMRVIRPGVNLTDEALVTIEPEDLLEGDPYSSDLSKSEPAPVESVSSDTSQPKNGAQLPVPPSSKKSTPARICPKCGRSLVVKTAQRGPNKGKKFYGCTGFSSSGCRYTAPYSEDGKDDLTCPKCGKPLEIKTAQQGTNKGKKFYGCTGWPDCHYTAPYPGDSPSGVAATSANAQAEPRRFSPSGDDGGGPTCPECGKPLVVHTAHRGANAGKKFYGCSGYPDCHYTRPVSD